MITGISAVADIERFRTFGSDHIALLLVVILITAWFLITSKKKPESPRLRFAEQLLAILLLAHWPLRTAIGLLYGMHTDWQNALPMHLCDWAAVAAAIALLNRNPRAVELSWFWGIGATLQGLLTPALTYPFPHPLWFTFFLLHGGVVIAAVQLVVGRRHPPSRKSWLSVLIASEIYIACALAVNTLLGTNYGFLSEKPSQPSLLDYFGDGVMHLVGLHIAMIIAITLLWLPFQLKRTQPA